jgi:hypothetical protein
MRKSPARAGIPGDLPMPRTLVSMLTSPYSVRGIATFKPFSSVGYKVYECKVIMSKKMGVNNRKFLLKSIT